jgi:hypothetical protein
MAATITEQTVHALEIVNEEEIAAPIDVVLRPYSNRWGPRMRHQERGAYR